MTSELDLSSRVNLSCSQSQATLSYYAITQKGLSYPKGTDATGAFEVFENGDHSRNVSSIAKSVRAFVPEIQCTPVRSEASTPIASSDDHSWNMNITLYNVPCPSSSTGNLSIDTQLYLTDVDTQNPSREIYGFYMSLTCGNTPTIQQVSTGNTLTGTASPAYFAVVDLRWLSRNVTLTDNTTLETQSPSVSSLSTVMCTSGHSIQNASLSLNTQQQSSGVPSVESYTSASTGTVMEDFDDGSMLATIMCLLNQNAGYHGITTDIDSSAYPAVQSLLYILLDSGSSAAQLIGFLDNEAFSSALRQTLNGVATQWASSALFTRSGSNATAVATIVEPRLRVRTSSVWIMATCFLVIAILVVLLTIWKPRRVLLSSPYSLYSISKLLKQASDFTHEIQCTGSMTTKQQHRHFGSQRFYSIIANDRQTIKILGGQSRSSPPVHPSDTTTLEWYRPFAARKGAIMLIIVLPIVLIGVLEALQRISDSKNGIASVYENSMNGYAPEIWAQYIPTLIMFTVGSLYNSLGFNIAMFSPYSQLRSHRGGTSSSLAHSLNSEIPIRSLYLAFRKRQWGASLSTTAALLATLLTIVVSGLYAANPDPIRQSTNVLMMNSLNTSWWNDGSDNEAGLILSLIDQLNLTTPKSTYQDLVLPDLELPSPGSASEKVLFPLDVTLPTYRASLNCTAIPPSNYTATVLADDPDYFVNITVSKMDLPPNCDLDPVENSPSFFENGDIDSHGQANFGHMLQIGTFDSLYQGQPTWNYTHYCPSLAFVFGRVVPPPGASDNNVPIPAEQKSNITVLICHQNLQKVNADIGFASSAFDLDPSQAPLVDESSTSLVSHDMPGVYSFGWSIDLATGFTFASNITDEQDQANFDTFFLGALGSSGVSNPINPIPFLGGGNVDRLLNALNAFYRSYMAQVINRNMAIPWSAGAADQVQIVQGFYDDPETRFRISQNSLSKWILQGVLAAMVICGVLAYWLTDMRHTLPHEPCSIAGRASLVAGSSVVGMTEQELERKRLKLGWWDEGGNYVDDTHSVDAEKSTSSSTAAVALLGDTDDIAEERKRHFRFGIDVLHDPVE